MRKLFLVAAMLMAVTAWADVTGTWSGTLQAQNADGQQRDMPAYVVLKQDGTKVTGTGGPNAGEQMAISNGRIDGDKLLFEIDRENGSVMKFELTAAEDQIEGTVTHESQERKRTGKLSLKREKQ